MEETFSKWTYLLSSERLGTTKMYNFNLNFFPDEHVEFEYVKIDVDEFYSY